MQGNADGVQTSLMQKPDVVLGNIRIALGLPELFSLLGSDPFIEEAFDLVSRLRAASQAERTALRLQPIAQVRAAQLQALAIQGDQVLAVRVNEPRLSRHSGTNREDKMNKPFAFHS